MSERWIKLEKIDKIINEQLEWLENQDRYMEDGKIKIDRIGLRNLIYLEISDESEELPTLDKIKELKDDQEGIIEWLRKLEERIDELEEAE